MFFFHTMSTQSSRTDIETLNAQLKRLLLITRRALLMIVRGIESMYPEEFRS